MNQTEYNYLCHYGILGMKIDKHLGNRGKNIIYGSAATPDSLNEILNNSLFDIYLEKYK